MPRGRSPRCPLSLRARWSRRCAGERRWPCWSSSARGVSSTSAPARFSRAWSSETSGSSRAMSSSSELQLDRVDATPGSGRAAGIVGFGSALPSGIVSSNAIAQRIGVPAGWIERRTGIRRRRHAGADDRVWRLAAAAGSDALAAGGMDADALDLVLVAALAPDDITPNAAPLVAQALGATSAGAIDVGAACTGFVSALELGAACIESGRAEGVLVVGAEIMSRFVDHGDRRTAGLFGDGAGAVVLAPGQSGRVGASVLGCDGAAAEFIRAPRATGLIEMDGHETFRRAVATLCENARQT